MKLIKSFKKLNRESVKNTISAHLQELKQGKTVNNRHKHGFQKFRKKQASIMFRVNQLVGVRLALSQVGLSEQPLASLVGIWLS